MNPRCLICIALLCLISHSGHAVTPTVAAGERHALALKSDGTVWAWGNNGVGQLGTGLLASKFVPTTLWAASDTQAVAAGIGHSLALNSDGSLWAWGANNSGQLGDGTTTQRSEPVKVNTVNQVIAVAAGDAHSLALRADGAVWAWGRNLFGQLGNGSTNNSSTSILIGNLSDVSAVAAGSDFSVALKRDGTVWTWGYNEFGQLGNGGTTNTAIPQAVPGLTNIVAVAAGGANVLVLKRDGTVWGWGKKQDNSPYSGTVGSRQPVQFAGLIDIVQLAIGAAHSMALQRDGTVWVWGWNFGGLGNATTLYATAEQPIRFNALSGVSRIAAGAYFSLAVKNDGSLWAWGQNFAGELANGNAGGYVFGLNPTLIVGVDSIKSIAAGYAHVLAAQLSGKVVVWGAGNSGQLGLGETGIVNKPLLSLLSVGATAIAAGDDHSLALATNGAVWAWGGNYEGQLGDGTTTDRAAPVTVLGLSSVTDVSAGWHYSLAVTADGNVWAWGRNMFGLLGTADTGYPKQPSTVIGLADIESVSAGYNHSLALDRNGSVWAWGWNANGELGDGSGGAYLAYKTTPTRLRDIMNIVGISAGWGHSLAVAVDGTVWAWGKNEYGQLGVGEALVDRCQPSQDIFPGQTFPCSIRPRKIPGLDGVIAVSAGSGFSLGLLRDGTVRAWGRNDSGQLGDGTTISRPSPIQVPGLTGVGAVAGAGLYGHALALRSDGTVWAWGSNDSGQLGDGTYALHLSPVLVINDTVTGILDLDPSVPNNIPASAIPSVILEARKLGGLVSLTLGANVYFGAIDLGALTAGSLAASAAYQVSAAAVGSLATSGPYKVYVAAILPDGISGVSAGIYLLNSNRNWSYYSGGPLPEYVRNATLDQTLHYFVSILEGMDLTGLIGTRFLVGYGTDDQEMLAAQRYREIYVVQPDPVQ